MTFEKQIFIAIWVLIFSGGMIYLIKNLAFLKRKKDKEYNISESIYLGSLLFSTGSMIKTATQFISKTYDITYKQFPNNYYLKTIQTSSVISVTGIILLLLTVIFSKFCSGILFPKRSELLEFENNSLPYGIIRAVLLLMLVTTLSFSRELLLGNFVPNDIPFFRR